MEEKIVVKYLASLYNIFNKEFKNQYSIPFKIHLVQSYVDILTALNTIKTASIILT